jgi:hypothetical protein
LQSFGQSDTHKCLGGGDVIFIGDSTVRQIFWSLANKLDPSKAKSEYAVNYTNGDKHTNATFTSHGVQLLFYWDPWLNSTVLLRELENIHKQQLSILATWKPEFGPDRYDISLNMTRVIIGAPGLWNAKYEPLIYMENFRNAVDRVVSLVANDPPIPKTFQSALYSWRVEKLWRQVYMAPIQVPSRNSPCLPMSANVCPITNMQNYLRNTSVSHKLRVLWSFNDMTSNFPGAFDDSGIHVIESVALRKADIVTSLICNASFVDNGEDGEINWKSFPHNGACCSYRGRQPLVNIILPISQFLISLFHIHVSFFRPLLSSRKTFHSLAILSFTINQAYQCDRTLIFEKSSKRFELNYFISACLLVLLAGASTIRQNRKLIKRVIESNTYDHGILSRDQTDEWKGWMQFIILIYHYMGASNVLWVYEIVRVLVGSYVFMSAYGHTLYFLRTSDFSFKRVVKVLLRLNLLSCSLSYIMGNSYQLYYFAPLISFWFLFLYFLLRFKHEYNSCTAYIINKAVIGLLLLQIGFSCPVFILQAVFDSINKIFGSSWEHEELHFRLSLDRFAVFLGVLVAYVHERHSKNPSNRLMRYSMQAYLVRSLQFMALVTIIGYLMLIQLFTSKILYNSFHPVISIIPLFAFIMLRNSTRALRNHHSAVFAWMGRISLETYVLQYHLWLANDTKSLLRLGLLVKWKEAALITLFFLWGSWKVSWASDIITELFVEGNILRFRQEPEYTSCKTTTSSCKAEVKVDIIPLGNADSRTEMGVEKLEMKGVKEGRRVGIFYDQDAAPNQLIGDLRFRVALLLVAMWVYNITHHITHHSEVENEAL